MTQISLIVNSMPRDLTEFAFFLVVGFTAGSIGLIWLRLKRLIKLLFKNTSKVHDINMNWYFQIIRSKVLIPQENQILISHWVQSIQQQLVSQKFSYHLY